MANKTTPISGMPDIAGMPVSAQLPPGFEEVPTQQPVNDISGMPVSAELPPGFEVYEEPELTPEEAWKGRAEAVSRGLFTRPGTVLIQKALGITPEESAFREKKLGGEATAYEFGAMALPAIVTLGGSLAAKAGLAGVATGLAKAATLGEFTQAGVMSAIGKKAVEKAAEKGLASAAGKVAVQFGVENALFAAADETAKALEGNPNSVSQAAWNVGLSGLTGMGLGAGIGKAGELWKTKYGPAYKSFTKDFASRWKDVTKGDLPAADVVASELQTVFDVADDVTNEIYGISGLKRQELKKLLPDLPSTEIKEAANKALYDADKFLKTLATEGDTFYLPSSAQKQISAEGNRLVGAMMNPNATGAELFAAVDDFKKVVGDHSKFDVKSMPIAQEKGAKLAKDLFHSLKSNLEDEIVWGMAAKRQNEINKASSKFFQAKKPFQTLATAIGPDNKRYVDPAKLETLIKQSQKGTARGVDKQARLDYFLDVVDDLYDTIENIDKRLGTGVMIERPTMTASRAVTQKLTPGMKAADYLYGRAIEAASEAGGLAIGYKMGKGLGIPFAEYLGAAFGHYQLKPLLKTVLPVVVKPMLTAEAVGSSSLRAAGQVIGAVATGETLSKLAADSLWLKDKPVKGNNKSDPKHLEKLDKQILEMQRNPQSLIEMNDDLSELLPKQGAALSATAMNAMSYLIEKRPFPKQNMPLDKIVQPTKAQMMDYYRTLEIAENPLVVVKKIKDGNLKSKDVVDFRTMYPTLYDDLMKKIMSSYADHLQKGGAVSYKVKKGLSLLTASPLDSTFTPQAMQAAQSTYQPKNLPAPQEPQFAAKSSRKSRVPEMTQTEQQRRILKD